MKIWLEEIKTVFKECDDFFLQHDYLYNQPVILFGLSTLIDIPQTKKLIEINLNMPKYSLQEVIDHHLVKVAREQNNIIDAILEGKIILYIPDFEKYMIMEVISKSLNRSIELPTNENVIQDALDSFIEDIDTNIGIIRKHFRTKFLITKVISTGIEQEKKIALLGLEAHVNQNLMRKIETQLKEKHDQEIHNAQSLVKTLGFSAWDIVPKYKSTEIPTEVIASLKKGKVVLIIDDFPFALIFPNFLWDMFTTENERNLPIPLMLFIRVLRVIGVIVATLMPGLYVALVSVNPEVLQLELGLSIAQSREGVPYPALVEVLMMLVILELILEASVRLPKSIGPTLTMVGGIILGQAIISAKLVSNLLTIVVAGTTIANATVVGIQNHLMLRLLKYVIVILAAIYGVLGIIVGTVLICAYFASINVYGISYLDYQVSKDESNNG
ncbi:spore germination protein [Shimazuella alba]|uniref:Spore gernimation protein GerA n=1 Tax=Shimazuella alba TaxID=2690964 RepID=A0A6I4VVC8_9BACL|nr:spore germination protein [Shimazuella alba]MXQ55839.1 spore gernimation protein GerA [Shimazuella alba]